jgi:hypothetical protein
MSASATPESVATWMLGEIERDGDLYQDVAVVDISSKFGDEFTYENDSGNLAISKSVLAAFRKLTNDSVVWERGERRWRKRERSDDPGRQQL